MESLLRGITVLDLTQYLSGPFSTQILGDLGAHVLKVEPPTGDLSRAVPPTEIAGVSTYYLSVNRNKRGMVLDLKTEAGREALLRLVPHVDAVVENFRPGVTDKLGIGWETLHELNPRLVMCSITGYGQSGPLRDHPAFDMAVQALSGVMSLTGHVGGPPARAGVPIGDTIAGMYGTIGVLAALLDARSTGVGRQVDVAMLDSQIAMLSYLASAYMTSGDVPGPQGAAHQSIPTYRAFSCRDGVDVVITANTDQMWRDLCAATGLDDLAEHPLYATHANRLKNREALVPLVEAGIASVDSTVLIERLEGKVPIAPINDVARALALPQVEHRSMVLDLTRDDGTVARAVGNPVKVIGVDDPQTYPPALGEHTEEILRDVAGLSDDELRRMADAGAFGRSTTNA